MKRMLHRICSDGCSHPQNCMWLVWSPSK